MVAWLIYDREGAARNADYIQMHRKIAEEFQLELHFMLDTQVEEMLGQNSQYPDFCFVRTIQPTLSEQLEEKGITVWNPASVSRICNDKGRTIRYIQEHSSVPVIPTGCFERGQLSRELIQKHPHCVIKSVAGHGGTEVFLTSEPYEKIEAALRDSRFVIQPFLAEAKKDIRVYVIGEQVMGAVARSAQTGFRSNFSLGGAVAPYTLTEREYELVGQVCRLFSFGMVGIDFLVPENGKWLLNEIEDVVGARMFYHCYPRVNLLREYFSYCMGK